MRLLRQGEQSGQSIPFHIPFGEAGSELATAYAGVAQGRTGAEVQAVNANSASHAVRVLAQCLDDAWTGGT